jgi:hypothetical protein
MSALKLKPEPNQPKKYFVPLLSFLFDRTASRKKYTTQGFLRTSELCGKTSLAYGSLDNQGMTAACLASDQIIKPV